MDLISYLEDATSILREPAAVYLGLAAHGEDGLEGDIGEALAWLEAKFGVKYTYNEAHETAYPEGWAQ